MLQRTLLTALIGLIALLVSAVSACADTLIYKAPPSQRLTIVASYGDAVILRREISTSELVLVRGQSLVARPGYTMQDIAPDERGVPSLFLTRKRIAYKLALDSDIAHARPQPVLRLRRRFSFGQFAAWGNRYATEAGRGLRDGLLVGRWGQKPRSVPIEGFGDIDLRDGGLVLRTLDDTSPHDTIRSTLYFYDTKRGAGKPCRVLTRGAEHDHNLVGRHTPDEAEIDQAQMAAGYIVWSEGRYAPARVSLGRTPASCAHPHPLAWQNRFPGFRFGLTEGSLFYVAVDPTTLDESLVRADSLPVFSASAP